MAVQILFWWDLLLGKFSIALIILEQFPSSFFSMHFVGVHIVHPYSCIETTAAWKKFRFILPDRSDIHMIDDLSIAIHDFAWCILTSLSVDETLLPRYVYLSTNSTGLLFRVKIAPSRLKYMHSILFAFTWRPMPPVTCSSLCSRYSS